MKSICDGLYQDRVRFLGKRRCSPVSWVQGCSSSSFDRNDYANRHPIRSIYVGRLPFLYSGLRSPSRSPTVLFMSNCSYLDLQVREVPKYQLDIKSARFSSDAGHCYAFQPDQHPVHTVNTRISFLKHEPQASSDAGRFHASPVQRPERL